MRSADAGLSKAASGAHIFRMAPNRTLDLLQQRRNRVLNTVHTWLLGGGSLLLLVATAWALAGPQGIIFAVVFGLVSLWLVGRVSPQMVLSMYKARAVGRDSFPVGVDLVQTLSARAGLSVAPRLYVIPSRMLNAFAVGRREEAAIAITDGLARHLTVRELAGVLAHEISHVAHGDVKVMALADMVSRFTSIWSTFGFFALFLNLVSAGGGAAPMVPWPAVLLLIVAPTVGGLLQLALSRTREFDADLGAAMLTGDPDGLASALVKLEKAQGLYWESLMLPGSRTPVPSVLRTHPQTADRVARLMALKAGLPPAPDLSDGPAMGPPPRRPSIVPTVRLPAGRAWAALVPLAAAEVAHDAPACDTSLAPPPSPPRVRIMRGGVYW